MGERKLRQSGHPVDVPRRGYKSGVGRKAKSTVREWTKSLGKTGESPNRDVDEEWSWNSGKGRKKDWIARENRPSYGWRMGFALGRLGLTWARRKWYNLQSVYIAEYGNFAGMAKTIR